MIYIALHGILELGEGHNYLNMELTTKGSDWRIRLIHCEDRSQVAVDTGVCWSLDTALDEAYTQLGVFYRDKRVTSTGIYDKDEA